MPIFSPTFVFFHIFLLFLSKLLMFSSPTILVPLGNKEADRWIVAKLCFQFLCWFFSDRTIIPGWCAGGRALYGCTFENKTQIHLNSIISLLSISNSLLVLFDERTIENVNQHRNLKESFKRKSGNEKRMKRISDSHAVDPEERWMEARWGERGKKWFLGKLQQFFPTKFFGQQAGNPWEYTETSCLCWIFLGEIHFLVKYSLSNCGGEDVTWVIGFPLLFSLSYITSHYF